MARKLVGFGMGYGNLTLITWAQRRSPKALMGRVISLILLGSVALVPVSQVIAGAIVTLSLSGMLLVAGVIMAVLTLGAAVTPTARRMGLEPVLDEGRASAG
jgi:hypothetical protein